MISYIKGTAALVDADCVVVENHGIGYQIKTPTKTRERIGKGQEVTLFTHLYVREDQLALFGFLTREELSVFQILLGVNGIGPKVALAVLSTMSVEELYYAVLGEDAKSIAKTPGIGPKGAKRMIIELKDKLRLEIPGSGEEEENVSSLSSDHLQSDSMADTMEALMALGYSSADAYRAVHHVKDAAALDAQQLLKEALKKL